MNETNTRPNTNYIDNNRAEQLLEKWSPVLDYTSDKVSPIENPHTRMNTAILLENQEEWCLREGNTSGNAAANQGSFGSSVGVGAGQAGGTYGSGDTYASNDARLPKILIPMIRRTFPELITNEIVGVQPMSGPVGLAFALRYKYSDAKIDDTGAATNVGRPGTNYTGSANTGDVGTTNELGHNNLDTQTTGASAAALVAALDSTAANHPEFTVDSHWLSAGFSAADAGFAAALSAFELDSAGDAPTVELSFEKTAVEAGTRRFNARWSVELSRILRI